LPSIAVVVVMVVVTTLVVVVVVIGPSVVGVHSMNALGRSTTRWPN
jgi:hypothetical protein